VTEEGRPAPGTLLFALEALADPGARAFARAGFRGFVIRRGDEVRGFVDACPHTGASLSNGSERYLSRDGDKLLCLQHGALFHAEDGRCFAGPCAGEALEPWPVRLRQGVVEAA
jgi:nitrite reductase/ring-hydroxylating ferredoxin subunit